jgi:hypothetical protein
MIENDIIFVSRYISSWRERMNCTSGAQVLIVAKSVLANRRIVLGVMAWSIDDQMQLDDGGENL